VIEGKIKGAKEVAGRRGGRRRKLLDDLKERRGYSHLKKNALDRTKWRARFGRCDFYSNTLKMAGLPAQTFWRIYYK
jgi:hypothetical protein